MSILAPESSGINSASPSGEQLKDAALQLLEARRPQIVLQSRRALLEAVLEYGQASIDDVRRCVELPPGISPKVFGSVPGELAKSGIIKLAGFTRTSRKEGHARPVGVWELQDREAALQWLASNPPPADTAAPLPE